MKEFCCEQRLSVCEGSNGGGWWREKTEEEREIGLKRESVGGGVLGRESGSVGGLYGGGGVGRSFGYSGKPWRILLFTLVFQ